MSNPSIQPVRPVDRSPLLLSLLGNPKPQTRKNNDDQLQFCQGLMMIASFQQAITSASYQISNSVGYLSDEMSDLLGAQKKTAKAVNKLFELTILEEMQGKEMGLKASSNEPPPGMYS